MAPPPSGSRTVRPQRSDTSAPLCQEAVPLLSRFQHLRKTEPPSPEFLLHWLDPEKTKPDCALVLRHPLRKTENPHR